MTFRFFEGEEHSALYQKYMIREPDEVKSLILSYLEEKGTHFGLAVDVGCGTGQSTRVLVPHFQKVDGIDNSKAQIQEARRSGSFPNLSYIVAQAEKLPFEDGSVDLITASVAAHWFIMEEFLREVDRVLKPNGCLALYCMSPVFNLHYKECSKRLTDVFMEAFNFLLREHGSDKVEHMKSEYKEIFDEVPFVDKVRVTGISMKRTVSFASVMGLIESSFMYQNFFSTDKEKTQEFMQELQERLLKIIGESSTDIELEISSLYFCVLACKSA